MTIILSDHIYKSRTVAEVVESISSAAAASGHNDDLDFAGKMERAHILTSDVIIQNRMADLLTLIRTNPGRRMAIRLRQADKAERVRKMMEGDGEWEYEKPRAIESSGRIKSFYSTAIKLLLLQEDAKQAKKEKKHPREGFLNDLYACRFIIEDRQDVETIGYVFEFFNMTLEYLEDSCNCVVLQSTGPVKTTNFIPAEHPTVILPTEDMKVLERFQGRYKDYFHFPKGNGYQCLHATVLDREYGFVFEIQILTRTAYNYVNQEESDEEGKEVNEDNVKTSHSWHKNKKYGKIYAKQGVLDFSKIQMPGFEFDESTQQLTDTIMLIKPGHFL